MPDTMKQAITDAVTEITPSKDLLSNLTVEQRGAIESKFNALPLEVRSAYAAKYPGLTVVGWYILRQVIKEANGKLASQMRPIWFQRLNLNAVSLKSGEKAIRDYAENQLRDLAESLDSKESATLLKKYKNTNDMTTKDAHIVQLAGIFGVSPATLA
jgi:hypothetical protein